MIKKIRGDMSSWSRWKIFKIAWFSLVTIFLFWNWTTFQSRGLPDNVLSNSKVVAVEETDDEIIFISLTLKKNLEVIFFQGGLVDPKAYAPLCRSLAENGYTCHIIKMAWRLAQYDYQKVPKIFDLKGGNYVIGGHSQGAKMAARLVFENPVVFKGLFLMGTSHPRDIDMSGMNIPTLKLYAELDGLASVSEVLENKSKLPGNAELVLIKGGNHSQFGYTGKLLMDNSATVSVTEQQELVLDHLLKFFSKI
jgi:hypothetical protein